MNYQASIIAGVKRIDLDGNETQAVTPLEQRAAKLKYDEACKKIAAKRLATTDPPAVSYGDLPRFLKQIEATPMKKIETTTPPPSNPVVVVKPLKRLLDSVLVASAAIASAENTGMLAAITVTMMGIVIKEAQSVIDDTEGEA
jgi:hypothetical protein